MKIDNNGRKTYTLEDYYKAVDRKAAARDAANATMVMAAISALTSFGCIIGLNDLADITHKNFFQFLGQATHLTVGLGSAIASVTLGISSNNLNEDANLEANNAIAIYETLPPETKKEAQRRSL